MTMAITGVPVVASDVQPVPLVDNNVAASAQGASIELPLSDFVTQMQGNPLGEGAHLASPGALASELFGSLRGYLEGARNLETAVRTNAADTRSGGAMNMASGTPPGAGETELHSGPAREHFEPAGSAMSASTGVNLAQLQRTMDLAVRSMGFWSETTLVVHGTGQVSHSTNTLIKGQ